MNGACLYLLSLLASGNVLTCVTHTVFRVAHWPKVQVWRKVAGMTFSDISSGMRHAWVVPLTGLNHCRLRQVLRVTSKLHANLVGPGMEVGCLLAIVAHTS